MTLCGAGSLPHDEDDVAEPSSPKAGPPKKAKQQTLYSTRGLDKFSAVLAELGARKEQIMAMAGSRGVAMVRFVYDNSKDWVPVIVRPKQPPLPPPPPPSTTKQEGEVVVTESTKKPHEELERKGAKHSSSYSLDWKWKDSYYWPVVVVLILVCLVVLGRVFAICCTCVWWYMTPTLKEWSGKSVVKKLVAKKKKFVRSRRLNYDSTGNVD